MKTTHPDPMTVPYSFCTTTEQFLAVCRELAGAIKISIDTETEVIPGTDLDVDGPGPWAVTSIAAEFASEDGTPTEKVWVIDMTDIDCAVIAPAMANLVSYSWNANFERKVFGRDGIRIGRWVDLMLFKADLDTGLFVSGKVWYTGLSQAARQYFGFGLEGKGGIQLSFKPGVPLSDEQKAYAAQDAIVALWLGRELEAEVAEAGLTKVVDIDCRAQPFIDDMTTFGIPFDVEGWMAFIAGKEASADASLVNLAALTGGGQATLFDPTERPTWNPGSDVDVKRMLNTYAAAEVTAFSGHLLGKEDSVDKQTLTLIGGPLCEAILALRADQKMVSTYGAKQVELVRDDGRFHPRFLQSLVDTGRLSSDKPNFQNQPPESKRYTRPARGRLFVAGDLSQAELRQLAQISGDPLLIAAFVNGEDLHVATAERMFGVDMKALKKQGETDPKAAAEFKVLRAKGKTLNFGMPYGLSGSGLATRLTAAGVPTTKEEGGELLRLYAQAFPGVAAWLQARDQFIAELAANPPACDWHATWRLQRNFKRCTQAFFRLKKRHGVSPSYSEIAEDLTPRHLVERELERKLGRPATEAETTEELALRARAVEWVLSFKGAVVVTAEGRPFTFESRTPAGRRRLFNVSTDEWLTSMLVTACTSRKPRPGEVRDDWARQHNMVLTTPDKSGKPKPLSRDAVKKRFEDKDLKASFVDHVLTSMPEAAEYLMRAALSDCIRSKGNQYRNAPIQGGVADAVLLAYGLLDERLGAFPDAHGILSVHDSIVIECDAADAERIRVLVRECMEAALAHFCPDVPVVADVDIQASLDAKDTLEPEQVAALVAELEAERTLVAA